jgi:hypothetical protein
MNFILTIEGQIYDLLGDLHELHTNDKYYDRTYWAARGMCRVACQFTNDADEADMFDRIQQAVLTELNVRYHAEAEDEREEVAAEVTAHVESVVDDKTSATLEELFGAVSKPLSENKGSFEIPGEPMETTRSDELFF